MKGKPHGWGRFLRALSLGNASIKTQLILLLAVVVVPFVSMGVITYSTNMDIVSRMLSENKLRALAETARTVDQLLGDVEQKARQIGWDSTVQAFLSRDADLRNYEDYRDATKIQDLLAGQSFSMGYVNTMLVVPGVHASFTTTRDGKGILRQEDAMAYGWFAGLDKNSGEVRWYITSNMLDNPLFSIPTVTCASPVKLFSSFQVAGYVLISLDRNAFKSIISTRSTAGEEQTYLIDAGHRLICAHDGGKSFSADNTLNADLQTKSRGWYYNGSGAGRSLVAYVTLPRYGWQLVSVTSVSAVSAELIDLSKMMYAVIAACVLLSLVLAALLYRGIARPLDTFVERMESISLGNFTPEQANEGTNNEIKLIYNNFNRMSGRIARLISDNNATMLQKRDAELRALQAQINPHFLYNMLDTINWMAILKDESDISRAITALSSFYRLTLSDGRDTVTIRQEIEQLKAYVELERLRYKNSFEVAYELDEALLELETVKFILQPFVENALMHGFNYAKPGNRVTVRVRREERAVVMEVEDNGQGIGEEQLRAISSGSRGYGIANVDERLKLRYGAAFGVQIVSGSGGGTVVRILIPG